MTRKDYELIASALRTQREFCAEMVRINSKNGNDDASLYWEAKALGISAIKSHLAVVFKKDNARFDFDRWNTAC